MGHLLLTVLAALGLAQSGTQPSGVDRRADHAFQFFSSFCLTSNGNRDRALAVLGDGNELTKKLPQEMTDALLRQKRTVGWAVRTPSNALLMLAYGAEGHCEMRVQQADEAALVRQFENMRTAFQVGQEDTLPPQVRTENGARRTFRAYKIKLGSQYATVAMTTSDKLVGEHQHLLTFDMPNG